MYLPIGFCLMALLGIPSAKASEKKYLWGQDRMGKMVQRQAPSTSSSVSTRALVADSSCANSPLTRSCWSNGYSIATDFDQKHPTTGKTVSYSLEITNTTCNPDGNGEQQCLLINNQYPGPVITADWGDMLSITVTNSMQDNGTSLHWHGIRQLGSTGSDGVNGLTECPLAPGRSRTYTFQATQFGTSWYHSHHSSQYGMGVVGSIVIHGPASVNYDIDLGPFPLTDWYYRDAAAINAISLINTQSGAAAPASDTLLVNGTNNNGDGGKWQRVTVTPGKKHRLRLINTSADTYMRVKLDNHAFTVMSADFIPTKSISGQEWLLIGIGQRYDVVFTANQSSGIYWFRVEAATDCLSSSNGNGRALFAYSDAGSNSTTPTDSNETPPTNGCADLATVPYWDQSVDESTFTSQMQTLGGGLGEGVSVNGQNLVLWNLNTTSMYINWEVPTMQYLFNGSTNWPAAYDVIQVPTADVWTYWLLQMVEGSPPVPHPIHLHGHDFFVLGQGANEQFDVNTQTSSLNFENPPRRDTATLPAAGWLLIAYPANNPGVWIMHCHIAWHISQGLGVQFLEVKDSIVMPDETQFNEQCAAWREYSATMAYPQEDSGL